jgi:hypothetical protein
MPAIAATDLARMRDALLFDGPDRARKLSRFWALLLLNASAQPQCRDWGLHMAVHGSPSPWSSHS